MSRSALLLCLTLIASAAPRPAAAQMTATAAYDSVEVNGISLAYRIIGTGEPLVMLHGFKDTSAEWEPMFETFSAKYRLIVPDLRGHGHSTNPSGEFTHRQAARDILALLDHLGIERFKAMGESTGGMTLLHMATSQPERVEAMVLIAATSYFPEQAREIMRSSSPDSASPEHLAALARKHSRGMEQARALMSQFHALKDNYDDMNFTPPYLSTITARTLIVHGDRDEYFPVSIPVEQYGSIPNSYLWIVPNAGHELLWGERGQAMLSKYALEFLAGEWE